MIDRDQIVSEDELNAYVDGELPADRRGAVEAWLTTHPDDAAKVAAWRKHAEFIRARYGAVVDEKPPQRLECGRVTRRRHGRGSAAPAARRRPAAPPPPRHDSHRHRRGLCRIPGRWRRRLDRPG